MRLIHLSKLAPEPPEPDATGRVFTMCLWHVEPEFIHKEGGPEVTCKLCINEVHHKVYFLQMKMGIFGIKKEDKIRLENQASAFLHLVPDSSDKKQYKPLFPPAPKTHA